MQQQHKNNTENRILQLIGGYKAAVQNPGLEPSLLIRSLYGGDIQLQVAASLFLIMPNPHMTQGFVRAWHGRTSAHLEQINTIGIG